MVTGAAQHKETTRDRILMAAFLEFYRHGFQGGSINRIVESAGVTKGALFHHFSGKQTLGYAVVDEIVGTLLKRRWLDPIQSSSDPVRDLKSAFRRYVEEDIASGSYLQGCPLNNLAQEMSPLDDGFRERINELYTQWRAGIAEALRWGMVAGSVREGVATEAAAALVVASQMGIWGTAKSSQKKELMREAADALCGYLDSLSVDE